MRNVKVRKNPATSEWVVSYDSLGGRKFMVWPSWALAMTYALALVGGRFERA